MFIKFLLNNNISFFLHCGFFVLQELSVRTKYYLISSLSKISRKLKFYVIFYEVYTVSKYQFSTKLVINKILSD